jgi:NADPH-dependent 2,4-dienoyl-CoA reductase/sulfur reductase-like enzyme
MGAEMNFQEAELVIIGGGPAGLAAAIKARESGVDSVTILERAEELGGLLHQCIHNGFGLHYFKEDLTGPEYAYRFIEKAEGLGVNCLLETMVLDIKPSREILAVNARDGLIRMKPEAMVLSMGCRERSRGALNIPGTRPAGIFTAGTAQRIVNVDGYIPGKEIVILGSGDVGMIMARRMSLEGAEVKALIEILPYIGGLIRNEVQCLRDFDIPVFLEHTVVNIHGVDRINAVTVAKVDKDLNPVPGTEKRIDCDTLFLSVGLIPENELSQKANVALNSVTGGPIVDETMQTTIPGIFAGGNVVHVHDLVDYVSLEAESAGLSAAEYVQGTLHKIEDGLSVKPGKYIKYVLPTKISGKKDVDLYMRVAEPKKNAKVTVTEGSSKKAIAKRSFSFVRPSEMIKLKIKAEKMKGLRDIELHVNCTE